MTVSRLVVGVPVLVLPLVMVMAFQYWRAALLPLAVAYLVALAAAGLVIEVEKASGGRR